MILLPVIGCEAPKTSTVNANATSFWPGSFPMIFVMEKHPIMKNKPIMQCIVFCTNYSAECYQIRSFFIRKPFNLILLIVLFIFIVLLFFCPRLFYLQITSIPSSKVGPYSHLKNFIFLDFCTPAKSNCSDPHRDYLRRAEMTWHGLMRNDTHSGEWATCPALIWHALPWDDMPCHEMTCPAMRWYAPPWHELRHYEMTYTPPRADIELWPRSNSIDLLISSFNEGHKIPQS